MIIRHQTNISAFAGNHVYYWLPQQLLGQAISINSGAGPVAQYYGVYLQSIPSLGQSFISGRFA